MTIKRALELYKSWEELELPKINYNIKIYDKEGKDDVTYMDIKTDATDRYIRIEFAETSIPPNYDETEVNYKVVKIPEEDKNLLFDVVTHHNDKTVPELYSFICQLGEDVDLEIHYENENNMLMLYKTVDISGSAIKSTIMYKKNTTDNTVDITIFSNQVCSL